MATFENKTGKLKAIRTADGYIFLKPNETRREKRAFMSEGYMDTLRNSGIEVKYDSDEKPPKAPKADTAP